VSISASYTEQSRQFFMVSQLSWGVYRHDLCNAVKAHRPLALPIGAFESSGLDIKQLSKRVAAMDPTGAGCPCFARAAALRNRCPSVSGLHPSMPWVGNDSFLPHYLGLVRRALTQPARCRIRVDVGPALEPSNFINSRALTRAARAWILQRQAREREVLDE
jgi:hypothetical protein